MRKLFYICIIVLSAGAGAHAQQNFTVTMTVDNAYAIYVGDPVSATSLEFTTTNYSAGDIWVPETFNLVAPDISYVYIVTWSDDSVIQGALADFTNNTIGGQVLSGDPLWEVTATGINLNNGSPAPTLPQLTTEIVNANAGTNPSFGWVTPTASPMTNVLGGIHGVTIVGIDDDARWMWYDSGLDTSPPINAPIPFDGFNHNEYLIFRVPVTAPEPATLVMLGLGSVTLLRRTRKNSTA